MSFGNCNTANSDKGMPPMRSKQSKILMALLTAASVLAAFNGYAGADAARQDMPSRVDAYIDAISVPAGGGSYARWKAPICPSIAGLPKDVAEFLLRHLSQAAKNVDAPLAAHDCRPNLFVVATNEPALLLKKWHTDVGDAFDRQSGPPRDARFLNAPLPMRVWYNVNAGCASGSNLNFVATMEKEVPTVHPRCVSAGASSDLANDAGAISNAVVLVDSGRLDRLNAGQFADYIAFIGLAQIAFDRGSWPEQTILQVYSYDPKDRPYSLSQWDQSFLKALYKNKSGIEPPSDVKRTMVSMLAQ
jgi:hypothetical protein